MDDTLRWRWQRLAGLLGAEAADAERVRDDLAARHSEAHRAYHTLSHVRHVLDVIEFLRDHEPVDDLVAVELAAWFHDAVYDPRSDGNEAASARLAAEVLTDLQVPPDRVAHVHRLVLATADHRAHGPDEAVLVDADLAILASDPDTYDLYTRAVRVEYGHLGEDAWRKGRAAVLRGLAGRDPLFATETMRKRGEAVARRNLAGELARIAPD